MHCESPIAATTLVFKIIEYLVTNFGDIKRYKKASDKKTMTGFLYIM